MRSRASRLMHSIWLPPPEELPPDSRTLTSDDSTNTMMKTPAADPSSSMRVAPLPVLLEPLDKARLAGVPASTDNNLANLQARVIDDGAHVRQVFLGAI